MNSSIRYYDLDALRSILMSLGIVLHSANVFSPDPWAIQDAVTSDFYTSIVDFIHLFRMPAFFIVSGFFVYFSYSRSGSSIFITQRIPRIIIPLLVTAITLNSLQYWLLHENNHFLSVDYAISGGWVSHLWFLNCLIYYFLIAYICMKYFSGMFSHINQLILKPLESSKGLYLILLPLVSMVLIKISYLYPEGQYYNLSIPESIKYFGFFIFGIFIGANDNIRQFFLSIKATALLGISCLAVWLLNSVYSHKIISIYLNELIIWFICALIFFLFHSLLNKKITFFSYLSDASYSIYLFHHIFVIIFGLILIPISMPVFAKFVLLICTTFIVTNLIHYFLINKVTVLSYLFNGKNPKPIPIWKAR